ncbi:MULTISPECIES: M28 family metallopeptidase [unclassified Streptomyces]|uniref:M28 family metallopeptidase n=1 Tax=unclassified Streptomyces TaxID=2593676 RepID=UPI001BE8E61E|nr:MULTISPECIES: M20/M25/M40 family metallo-hydrolase [unclassified Streptomyces]MBT2406168.1 M20/M25/M40 family metallo-hydrolase [Streptomyces sp. ISL-21]MBT2609226.1 M20/M25/M40 family metallo-hydrolase [Streptomyces sp. ISL-87]
MSVLFFDIGATLADVSFEDDGSLSFRPRPRVFEALNAFASLRKGIISNPGTGAAARARAEAALDAAFEGRFGDANVRYFEDANLRHWGAKDSRGIFDEAVASADAAADECVFVGEDPDERAVARVAGMRTAAHPVFTLAALEGRTVFWTRIGLPARHDLAALDAIARTTEVVPVHVSSDRLVLAMATGRGRSALEDAGFTTDLRGPVEETAAFLLRDDRPVAPADRATVDEPAVEESMRASAAFAFVADGLATTRSTVVSLGPAPGGVYIAATAGALVERLHVPGAKPGHIERLLPDPTLLSRPGEARAAGLVAGFARAMPDPQTVEAVRAAVTPAVMRGHVSRVSGAAALVEGGPLKVHSRDAASEDNVFVADALAQRLRDLGLTVRLNRFTWRGHRIANVEAEHRVEGSDAAVLITAHLDSTGDQGEFTDSKGRPRRYDPAVDPAPGADDDGSGIAAVLAAAECLTAIVAAGRSPMRTVRFVLFNAEEQGLVGSKVYARAAAAAGDSIAGVLQMDMIAGRQGGVRTVEIHAGSAVPGPAAAASNELGDCLERATSAVSSGLTLERLAGADDPASGRSDHASFHERGWAAVAVCENFFDGSVLATGTRQYHRPGDTLDDRDHDTQYATEIARGVTTAALTLAGL